ncbi:MAG: twin-arginine translocase TatA/TatE family subunit [Oligoflexia bacterium]|nr:twin-arginine translocase TatA/TatE family subunit [Oligoflexia bacterium]
MGISIGHLLIVAIVVLLFGAKRLPELGASVGKGMKAFKDGLGGVGDEGSLAEKRKEVSQEERV